MSSISEPETTPYFLWAYPVETNSLFIALVAYSALLTPLTHFRLCHKYGATTLGAPSSPSSPSSLPSLNCLPQSVISNIQEYLTALYRNRADKHWETAIELIGRCASCDAKFKAHNLKDALILRKLCQCYAEFLEESQAQLVETLRTGKETWAFGTEDDQRMSTATFLKKFFGLGAFIEPGKIDTVWLVLPVEMSDKTQKFVHKEKGEVVKESTSTGMDYVELDQVKMQRFKYAVETMRMDQAAINHNMTWMYLDVENRDRVLGTGSVRLIMFQKGIMGVE